MRLALALGIGAAAFALIALNIAVVMLTFGIKETPDWLIGVVALVGYAVAAIAYWRLDDV